VADLETAFLEHFLDLTLAEGESMLQPERVLDDAERETVAVGPEVIHRRSAYRA